MAEVGKAKGDTPLVFGSEAEVAAFEQRLRLAHTQFVVDEVSPSFRDPVWKGRKAPGIARRVLSKLLHRSA